LLLLLFFLGKGPRVTQTVNLNFRSKKQQFFITFSLFILILLDQTHAKVGPKVAFTLEKFVCETALQSDSGFPCLGHLG
jgi:hypothetical protein